MSLKSPQGSGETLNELRTASGEPAIAWRRSAPLTTPASAGSSPTTKATVLAVLGAITLGYAPGVRGGQRVVLPAEGGGAGALDSANRLGVT